MYSTSVLYNKGKRDRKKRKGNTMTRMKILSSLTWSWEKYNHFSSENERERRHIENIFLFRLVICMKIRISESLFDGLELPGLSEQLEVKVSQETQLLCVCSFPQLNCLKCSNLIIWITKAAIPLLSQWISWMASLSPAFQSL